MKPKVASILYCYALLFVFFLKDLKTKSKINEKKSARPPEKIHENPLKRIFFYYRIVKQRKQPKISS